jgi:cytochrome c peroxidase
MSDALIICVMADSAQRKPYFRLILLQFSFALIMFTGCHKAASDKPIGQAISIPIPLGLPPLTIPPDNPPTAATIILGRKLFYDSRLSADGSISCSTCHNPRREFTDGAEISHGVGGAKGVRNAPTILNAAFLPYQFWDGRAATLEEQAASPIVDPVEMKNDNHKAAISRLKKDRAYVPLFEQAFGSSDITIKRVENAIASFERTALSGNSPFDRYEYGGDRKVLTLAQIRGLAVFLDPNRGNCATCHTIGEHAALFTDGRFHNTGEGVTETGAFSDVGRYHETNVPTDTGAFLTPILRNVAQTAPYMHDGRLKTLKEVVDFYAGQGNSNPYLDKEMKRIHLSGQDRADLVQFLNSLSGDQPPNLGPPQ